MGLFRDRWDSENYPSYEDYLDAKRNGTLRTNRAYVNTPTSSERKANLSSPAPHVADSKDHSLESQTKAIEAKVKVARDETRVADAKRFRDTSSKYGEPKPFASRIPNVQIDKKKQFKGLIILLAIVLGILPSFSKMLDALSDEVNPKKWFESFKSQTTNETLTAESTATTEAIEIQSYVTTALAADHFRLSNEMPLIDASYPLEVKDIQLNETSTVDYGTTSEGSPYFEVLLNNIHESPLSFSSFSSTTDASTFFNSDGTLKENAYIELVFTDLTNDGYKEIVAYYSNDASNPYVEVFYNTQNKESTFESLGYFESYKNLNITEEGVLQLITDTGELYDEITVTAEGLQKIEN